MLWTYGFHFKLFEKIEIERPEIKAKFLNKKSKIFDKTSNKS